MTSPAAASDHAEELLRSAGRLSVRDDVFDAELESRLRAVGPLRVTVQRHWPFRHEIVLLDPVQ